MTKALNIWLLAAVVLGLLFCPYVHCVLIGLTLAVVLFPLYQRVGLFCSRLAWLKLSKGGTANLAAMLAELTAITVLAVGILLPALVLYHNRVSLLQKGIVLYQNSVAWAQVQRETLGQDLEAEGWIELDEEQADRSTAAASAPEPTGKSLLDSLPPWSTLAIQTASGLLLCAVRLMVMLLVVHAALLYGPDLWGHILSNAPTSWRTALEHLAQRAKDMLRAIYVIHGLTAVAAFVIAVPVFWFILGRPYFFLAAVLAGFFQFIPLLGSVVLVSSMTLYFFAAGQGDKGWICLLLAFPLVVGVPDLIIRPALVRSQGRVSPFTMMIGFMTGVEAFGPSGFVLGPLFLELFVCFTGIMLYGSGPKVSFQAWNKRGAGGH